MVLPSLINLRNRKMAEFDEYINSLEGQDNVDPLVVAGKLHELHMQEIGTREAKIEQLNSTVAEKESGISERDQEIAKWKSKNFDLVMQIPGSPNYTENTNNDDDKPNGANIRIGDLFNDNVRKRHGIG